MGLSEGSLWPKIALVTIVVALIAHLVAFGSAHWIRSNPTVTQRSFHHGLWRFCTYPQGGGEYCDDYINVITDDWMKVSQSFMTLGMFTLLAAVGGTAAYAVAMQGDFKILLIALISCAVSAVFVLLGLSAYAGKVWEQLRDRPDGVHAGELSWGFGMACISFILSAISTIMLIIEMAFGEVDR